MKNVSKVLALALVAALGAVSLVVAGENGMAKQAFDAEPGKFRIAYDGWCATGVTMGKKIASNPELFTERNGTTYLFSSEQAKAMFDEDPAMTVARADEGWSKIQ